MLTRWFASGPAKMSTVLIVLCLLTAGCGTVALSVNQPVGTKIELYEKGKWFGSFGPDWWTGWDNTCSDVCQPGDPCELKLDARANWLDAGFTCFPRQYHARFDLSGIAVYPKTPTSVVEVCYERQEIPEKYQEVIRLWGRNQTLDVLTHVPADVLADVLYNLGDKFSKELLGEVSADVQQRAATDLKAMLEAPEPPTPKEVESWLKSFLKKEQLDQLCRWVREGVTLREVKWVRLGGSPRQEGVPVFWRLLKGVVELFIRQPEVRTTHVNFYRDVILRDLMVTRVETKLVNTATLKFYADFITYDTTNYTDRALPAIDLVQDVGFANVVRPTEEEEAELQRFRMTRSVRLETTDQAAAIQQGLPPAGLQSLKVTSFRSQILGALLEGEVAYLIVWNNPRELDPNRFLTTVVTTGPYGMARIWAKSGAKPLCVVSAAYDETDAPIGALVDLVITALDQRELFVKLKKPVAVISFGQRRIAPWDTQPKEPVDYTKAMQELTGTESK